MKKYRPKNGVRGFRDLEVYQKAQVCAVLFFNKVMPALEENDYPFKEEAVKCALGIPLVIAEAHSRRYENKKMGLKYLDKAMRGCDKMVVYLEQALKLYGDEVDETSAKQAVDRYMTNRSKILRLYKSWERFGEKK